MANVLAHVLLAFQIHGWYWKKILKILRCFLHQLIFPENVISICSNNSETAFCRALSIEPASVAVCTPRSTDKFIHESVSLLHYLCSLLHEINVHEVFIVKKCDRLDQMSYWLIAMVICTLSKCLNIPINVVQLQQTIFDSKLVCLASSLNKAAMISSEKEKSFTCTCAFRKFLDFYISCINPSSYDSATWSLCRASVDPLIILDCWSACALQLEEQLFSNFFFRKYRQLLQCIVLVPMVRAIISHINPFWTFVWLW